MSWKDDFITALSWLRQPKKRGLIRAALQLKGKKGIEVGGPSKFFSLKGPCPVYLFAKSIDGVNFSNETVWEGRIREGNYYRYYHSKTGYQYIAEASDLNMIPDDHYDFLLSCHSLEHVANPVKAVVDWARVLNKGGRLILVLPDKRFTFDVNRPYTTMAHLLDDYRLNTTEQDTTHFDEIIRLHDPQKDPLMQSSAQVEAMLQDNFNNRMAHHHVFDHGLVKELLEYCGFAVQLEQEVAPFHLVTVARKQ